MGKYIDIKLGENCKSLIIISIRYRQPLEHLNMEHFHLFLRVRGFSRVK